MSGRRRHDRFQPAQPWDGTFRLMRDVIVQEDGTLIPVGPNLCENPNLRQAFNEFHFNIHHSQVPGIGDIETLGPQNGAPGLHNGHGAEIVGVGGCGG